MKKQKLHIHFDIKKIYIPSLVGLFMATSFFIGLYLGGSGKVANIGPIKIFKGQTVVNKDKGKPSDVDFSLFWEAWDTLNSNYYKDADQQTLLYGAIKGMAQITGDPYTVYMDPQEAQDFDKEISGTFSGVGVEVAIRNNQLVIISALRDTPADAAGLRAKDIILKVDDKDTAGMTLDEAVTRIKGEEGSEVTLKIQRGQDIKDYKIVRKTINIDPVSFQYKIVNNKNIAVINISSFNQDTSSDFEKAIDDILVKGPHAVILDLRGNPGGYLNSAVSIASDLIDGGIVLIEEEKGGRRKEIKTDKKVRLASKKLIVLIDEGSASASEILAGAIQDRERGTIIGKKSFGKGVVQMVYDLAKGKLKVTVASWLTPKGHSINNVGITPDISVDLSEDDLNNFKDPQLDRALNEASK